MNGWTVILQSELPRAGSCTNYAIAGMTAPVRIAIAAEDAAAMQAAHALRAQLGGSLQAAASTSASRCTGPRGFGCVAWSTPACKHVLVVMASNAASVRLENQARAWTTQPSDTVVVPVIVGQDSQANVFPSVACPTLAQFNSLRWNSGTVAGRVLSIAMIDDRAGVFVSYLRSEASTAAEEIHDALTRQGMRVFLDRFSSTPGRRFPQELAEAMSGASLVVLLETPSLRRSTWTMWEASFAASYRIGPVAVNFRTAPRFPHAAARETFRCDPQQSLPRTDIDRIVKFVADSLVATAVQRRAYYETIVRAAARSRHGNAVHTPAHGVLDIVDRHGSVRAHALVSAAPAQLPHVRRLAQAAHAPALLAGEHHHLMPAKFDDLNWLARQLQISLVGSAGVYRRIRALLP